MNQVSSSEARQYRRKDTPSDYPVPPLAPGPLEAAKNDANNERRFDAFTECDDQRLKHNREGRETLSRRLIATEIKLDVKAERD